MVRLHICWSCSSQELSPALGPQPQLQLPQGLFQESKSTLKALGSLGWVTLLEPGTRQLPPLAGRRFQQ